MTLTDKKASKWLKWIMIKYLNNYNDHFFLTILTLKYMSSTSFIYEYVYLYSDIYLGYIILCSCHLYIFKHMFCVFTFEGQFSYSLLEKMNCFQYSFVSILYFCFVIFNETEVQIVFSERKWKIKFLPKTHLPITVTECWILPRKYFNWINVEYGDIKTNGSFLSSSFNNLYESLYSVFFLLSYTIKYHILS